MSKNKEQRPFNSNHLESVASLFSVDDAPTRRWVPRPVLNGDVDWAFLSWILEILYRNPRHGNPEDPLDCLIFVMLTRKTSIEVGKKVFRKLKKQYAKWEDLLGDRPERLPKLLHGSGLEDIRAGDIRGVMNAIKNGMGSLTLEPLRRWRDSKCIEFLTSLPGVGTKTARCVMMYTLGRKVFPADAHCIRILTRMGVIEDGLEHREAQEKLAKIIPQEHAYKLHVNLVSHGQEVCTSKNPHCPSCSIRKLCKYFRESIHHSTKPQVKKPTVVDLFCGAGGTSLGLSWANYEIIAATDQDSWACQTFILNHPEIHPERILCSDIRKVNEVDLLVAVKREKIDLLVGGPPCQGFSMIGKRVRGLSTQKRFIDDPRNKLYKEFVRFVRCLRPRIVVMENVPGLFSLRNGYYRKQILEDLDHGYDTVATKVDAFSFGVPQHRQRALFVGVSRGAFGNYAAKIVGDIIGLLDTHNKAGPTLNVAIADLPPLEQDDGAEVINRIRRRGRLSKYVLKMGAHIEPIIFNHVSRPLNVRDQLLYARLDPGETGHDAIEKYGARHLMVYRDDVFHDKYRRLVYDRPAPTIVAHLSKDGHMFIHPDKAQNRSITVREAARIQSFPDDFIFYGPRTHQFQHVGNAVPPLLAETIGSIIRTAVQRAGYDW